MYCGFVIDCMELFRGICKDWFEIYLVWDFFEESAKIGLRFIVWDFFEESAKIGLLCSFVTEKNIPLR